MHERNGNAREDRSTPWMCVALFAGLFAGAKLAESYYRSTYRDRAVEGQRDQLKRWEGEGGAIRGTVTTPPAA